MLNLIAKLLKMLNSETQPSQISAGFCFAMIVGLTPLLSLHNLIVVFFLLMLRVNLSAFLLGWGLFSGVAYLADPVFHNIGYKVLTMQALTGLWTTLYNITLFRLSGFNNSVLMGSLVVSIILFLPLLITLNFIIKKYRDHILAWIRKTKIAEILKSGKFFSIYQSLTDGERS